MQDYVETDYNTDFSSTFFYFQQCCMAWLLGEQSKKKRHSCPKSIGPHQGTQGAS